MSHRIKILLLAGIAFAWQAWGASVFVPFPGLTSSGAGLAEGALDTNFLLISAPLGVPVDTNPYVVRSTYNWGAGEELAFPYIGTTWHHNESTLDGTKWIGVQSSYAGPDRYHLGPTDPAGVYVFRLQFTMEAGATSPIISGLWAADNRGTIMLNGVEVAVSPVECASKDHPDCFITPTAFQISSNFIVGVNYLDFYIENEILSTGNPTGLWVQMSGGYWIEEVPEPATVATLGGGGVGLIGLALLRRRRQSQKS